MTLTVTATVTGADGQQATASVTAEVVIPQPEPPFITESRMNWKGLR